MTIPRVRVPVQLDKPRTLVLSLNALCKAEEVTGINLLVGEPAFSSMRIVRALVWAGLLHEDPTLTLETVGDMIEGAGAEHVLDAIMLAYMRANEEVDQGEDAEPADPTSPQPGETSGPSGATT